MFPPIPKAKGSVPTSKQGVGVKELAQELLTVIFSHPLLLAIQNWEHTKGGKQKHSPCETDPANFACEWLLSGVGAHVAR